MKKLLLLCLLLCNMALVSLAGNRKVLVEQFVSDGWSGWDPRGYAIEDYLHNRFGDDVVFVRYIHVREGDPLRLGTTGNDASKFFNFDGLPSTTSDRSMQSDTDFWEEDAAIEKTEYISNALKEETSVPLTFTASMSGADQVELSADFSTMQNPENYKITFILLADGCEISTCNFYASDLGDTNYIDELKQFVNGPNPVDIVSNNIAIAYSDLAGLPIDTNLNHGIMTYTFDIPRLGFIADCYKACAIITDKDGKCVNADMKVIDKPAVKPTIKTIRFSTDTLDLNVGSHLQIEVELDGDTGWELYDVPVWSSSDNYILSVDNSGLLSANAVGEAVVRVESSLKPSVYAEMTVSVHEVDKGFKLSLDGDKLYRETTVEIPVYLHNKYPMTGIQFDITLTDGLSFDCDESGNCNVKLDTSRTTDFSAASLLHEDNTLKVLITSFSGKYVNEGDGILFYIPIKVEASAPQTATVGISDIIVADPRNKAIKINDANRTFIIYDLKRGDVDGDSALTVADVTSIVSIILGQKEEGKIKEAADFNNDGKTDIMDVVTLINSILRSSSFKVRTTAARTDNAAEGIYIYEITEKGDDIYSVDLRVKDIDNYVAAQFDVALPEGLEFVTNDLGIEVSPDITATSNHIVSTSLQEDGSCRFISFSLSNSKYTDNEDKFLKFDIRKEEGCAENLTGEIRNILFSDANLSAVNFDDFTFNLNLGSNSVAVDLASALKISGVQGGIAVSNAPAGSDVLVYSLDGRLMNSIRVNEATVRIPAEKGIYIVRIQDTVKKVIVK